MTRLPKSHRRSSASARVEHLLQRKPLHVRRAALDRRTDWQKRESAKQRLPRC